MQPNYTPADFWTYVSVVASFWSKVDTSGECWLWKPKARSPGGYGVVGIGNKTYLAHRVAYVVAYGEDPGELLVCHHCDVRLCVRPDHLFLGTYMDNNRDMRAKGRAGDGRKRYASIPVERRPIGDRHGGSKLTAIQVRKIRHLYTTGNITQATLAEQFGVSRRTIGGIVRRVEWTHI